MPFELFRKIFGLPVAETLVGTERIPLWQGDEFTGTTRYADASLLAAYILSQTVLASQAEAEAGAIDTKLMTPLKTAQRIAFLRGAVNGIAALDGSGKVPVAQLPAIVISDVFVVASQAAMLALVAERGDIAIRTDLSKSFALSTDSPGTLADWKELQTPTDAVLSVAGLTGAITAAALRTALADTALTYTPTVTLVGGAGNVVPVYTTNTGRYVRIGNVVHLDVLLDADGGADGTGTGVVNVALPVAANAAHPTGIFVAGSTNAGSGNIELFGTIAPGGTTVSLSVLNTGFIVNYTGADQNSPSRRIRMKFWYEA